MEDSNGIEMPTMYSIYDVKADMWSPPVTFDTDEAFQQYLSILINTHGTGHYHLYPEDFIAYKLGYFDYETGKLLLTDRQVAVNLAGLKKPCKYCEKPEEIANEQSKQVFERSAG